MPYEIPQELRYEEKIVFNLTFKQLVYALLFGLPSLALFFKSNANLFVKIFCTVILVSLAIMFMFFHLDSFISDWLEWLKFRKAYKGSYKLRRFIAVTDVKDNLIFVGKRKLAVLKVSPINFSIKSQGEQEVILQVFQKLLNSVDFGFQILMGTESIDINSYLNSLGGRVSKNLKTVFAKFRKNLKSVVAKQGILDRSFYLVIPESNNLDIQIKLCEERLESLNLKTERLKNKELRKLLAKFFGGTGKGSLANAVSPNIIVNCMDFLKVDDGFCRVIAAFGYPRMVEAGFLDRIVSSVGDFDLSLHVQPFPIELMMVSLNKELQKQRADLYSAELKGAINPSLEIKYKDTRKILEELQKGEDKLFNVSLYINCKAKTRKELDLLSRKIESELNSLMIIPLVPKFRQAQGFRSVAPLAVNELNVCRNITTRALSAFFPFTSPFFQLDETGVWLGMNRNNIPIVRDIFRLSNPNGCILASSGAGKSYFSKLLISRYLLNGVRVMVVDPQGEYSSLVKVFGGQHIDLSRTSLTMINPLDLFGHDYADKRLSLMDLMQVMLGELTEPQKSFIDKALTEAYLKKDITSDASTWNKEPPILEDVLAVLVSMEKRALTLEKTTIRSLINRLSMYVDGVFSFMNRHTSIDFSNRFVCFDIGDMPKQVKPVIMFLVLDYVYMRMRENLERKLLVIDEAWSLLCRAEDASYIFEIVKTSRKFNLGLLMINQEVEGLLDSDAGKAVLANSAYTLLMRQKPAVIQDVQETFHLSRAERNFLLTANVGEGILLMDDDHSEIKIVASKEEHRLITTNADEILAGKQKQKKPEKKVSKNAVKERPKVSITVDEFKLFYKHSDLSLDDVKYLISKGYNESKHFSINSNKSERYLLKPRQNESLQHFFLIFDIANYLRRFTGKVWTFETVKPDIVFEVNKKKIAVEIETGKLYFHNKKRLLAKVEELNKAYDEWFFVLTNRNWISKYSELGKTFTKRNVAKKIRSYFKTPKSCH